MSRLQGVLQLADILAVAEAAKLLDDSGNPDKSVPVFGWCGVIEDELDFTVCDESGETEYGDFVEAALATTWIEI